MVEAVSLGLIVTELVINAPKYAFPDKKDSAVVIVRYDVAGRDWNLTVSDNGVGKTLGGEPTKGGLGTSLLAALAQQLGAKVEATSGPDGLRVAVAHVAVKTLPQAA